MSKIAKYLDSRLVVFLNVGNRDEVLDALVDALDKAEKLKNREAFRQAIFDREQVVSTGIGMGVAIPHAKMSDYDDFFIAIGTLQTGVDWHALDGAPVRLVFMIGGPDDKQTEYLQILSFLTTGLKDEERRKKMLTLNSPTAMIDLLKSI